MRDTVKVSALASYSMTLPSGMATRMAPPLGAGARTPPGLTLLRKCPERGQLDGVARQQVDPVDRRRVRLRPTSRTRASMDLPDAAMGADSGRWEDWMGMSALQRVQIDRRTPNCELSWPTRSHCGRRSWPSGWAWWKCAERRSGCKCCRRRPAPGSCPGARCRSGCGPGRPGRRSGAGNIDQGAALVRECGC